MKSAAIFPGLGSEYPGMLSRIRKGEITPDVFSRINRVSGRDILAAIMDSTGEHLSDPLVSQLAVFGASAYYWQLLQKTEVFHFLAGHSLGFYTALYASGSLSIEDCTLLIMIVQEAIDHICKTRPGCMVSVMGLRTEQVEHICAHGGDVYVSHVNSATQTVISGTRSAVDRACSMAREDGALGVKELPIFYPLHSPLMDGIEQIINRNISAVTIREPVIPIVSHLDMRHLDKRGVAEVIATQLARKVRWKDTIKEIRRNNINRFIEVGPSDILSRLVRWIERDALTGKAEELIPCPLS